jgi:tetratricopeptide (TPR) repeat protein
MPTKKPRHRKATLFQRFMLVLLGLFLLVVFELVLRLFGLGTLAVSEDPFVGFSGHHPVFETYRAEDGSLQARTVREKLKWFNEQQFPVCKDSGTFRIFTLGGSTAYGRPYGMRTSFSGWLEEVLKEAAEPARHFEVINAAGISYASYRVVLVLKEILAYQPDLVIIYTGHNEFLESRTYQYLLAQPSAWLRIRESLYRLRIYSLLESLIEKVITRSIVDEDSRLRSGGGLLSPEVETLLDRSAGLEYYQRDSVYARGVFDHFRFNVSRMISLCSKAGVPLLFCRPVDNLKDFSPFKSMPGAELASADRVRLERLVNTGRILLAEGKADQGLETLKKAVRLEPLYAGWFYLGRALLATGDTNRARQAFLQARELDVCSLRAQEPIHRILEEETATAGVNLLDLPALFASHSPGGIIGAETLIDHIHPLPEYNLLIAREIAGWMEEQGLLKQGSLPGEDEIRALYDKVMASLSDEYMSRGVLNLAKVMVWAKKFSEVRTLFEGRWDEVSHIGEAQYLMGVVLERLGEPQEALAYYEKALEDMPKHRQSYRQLAEAGEK